MIAHLLKSILAFSFFLTASVVAQAAQGTPSLEKEKSALYSRKSKLISQIIHRKLSRAQTLMNSKNFKAAFSILNKLAQRKGGRSFEKAQIQQTLGFAYAQADKLGAAIKSFEKALSYNALPAGPTLNAMYTLAQLYLSKEQHRKTIKIMRKWLYFAKKPSPAAYILTATAYAELKQFKRALPLVNKALKSGGEMRESWLQFAVALHYELKDYKSALVALKMLTARYPKKAKYWKQISGVYLNLDKNKQALVAMELAHKLGHITKQADLLNLISLYLDQNIPLKAAILLEDGIAKKTIKSTARNYEILSGAWIQARGMKKATSALKKAAPIAEHGNVFAQLGSLELEAEQWKRAAKTFKAALKKGKLRQPHQVRLGLGIALFQLQRYKSATKEFRIAQKGKRTKNAAAQWLAHVNGELARISSNSN